ncbi:MAG: single-stranded DNA-binding protein [Deltaproteobacteria bacterium]|nr:single-stranded DNA-binding protein [Deltaproteobacteria bacterium]
MASLNSCQFIGRIGRDPEIKYTNTGQTVASFSLAVDESYKDKSGQKIDQTEWIPCVAWAKQAEFIGNYLGKGRLVHVAGKWKTRKWQDKDGNDRYSTECIVNSVQALDKKPDGQPAPQQQAQQYNAKDDLDQLPF